MSQSEDRRLPAPADPPPPAGIAAANAAGTLPSGVIPTALRAAGTFDPSAHSAPLALAAEEITTARGYIDASRAASTRKAYAADWNRFCHWCRERAAATLPAKPALVAVYLAALAASGQAPPSIARALAAIAYAHRRAGKVAPKAAW